MKNINLLKQLFIYEIILESYYIPLWLTFTQRTSQPEHGTLALYCLKENIKNETLLLNI